MYNGLLNVPIILFLTIKIYGQSFDIKPLITIPGNNININISSPSISYGLPHQSYICWENKIDSKYSIYLKCIDPIKNKIHTVYSDTSQNINPSITYDYSQGKVIIVWQSKISDQWILLQRDFKDDVFGETKILTSNLTNNTNPTLSNESLAWIEDGNLIYKKFVSDPEIVDSVNCSNPKLFPYENEVHPSILYEKGKSLNKKIFLARHIGQIREEKPYWNITQISSGLNDINPSFGTTHHVSYQTVEDNTWKVVYQNFFNLEPSDVKKTRNVSCNFENPMIFTYPRLSKIGFSNYPYYFVAFDSDSIFNNREIFIQMVNDTIINISKMNGNDFKPVIAFLNTNDSSKIAIIWEHEENSKYDIYWGLLPFKLQKSNTEMINNQIGNFNLYQNYPNPFNASTTIGYNIKKPMMVKLRVYDILGREISTLVDSRISQGFHKANWNAKDQPSGIYLCRLETKDGTRTIRLLLQK
jgi:hypothetical protein